MITVEYNKESGIWTAEELQNDEVDGGKPEGFHYELSRPLPEGTRYWTAKWWDLADLMIGGTVHEMSAHAALNLFAPWSDIRTTFGAAVAAVVNNTKDYPVGSIRDAQGRYALTAKQVASIYEKGYTEAAWVALKGITPFVGKVPIGKMDESIADTAAKGFAKAFPDVR